MSLHSLKRTKNRMTDVLEVNETEDGADVSEGRCIVMTLSLVEVMTFVIAISSLWAVIFVLAIDEVRRGKGVDVWTGSERFDASIYRVNFDVDVVGDIGGVG